MRNRLRYLVALMACALLTGAACAGSRGTADAPQPTTEESPRVGGMQALLVGPLEGDPDRGCLWIRAINPVAIDSPEASP